MASIIEKSGSQEMSVALNQGAINLKSELLSGKDKERGSSAVKTKSGEVDVSNLLEQKEGKKLAVDILKPFLSKLAGVGIMLGTQGNENKLEDQEFNRVKDELDSSESFDDRVEISSTSSDDPITGIKKMNLKGGGGGHAGGGDSDNETLQMMKEFINLTSEGVTNKSVELQDKLKDIREKLREKGISDSKLQTIETNLKSGKDNAAIELLKDAMILNLIGSDSPIEKASYKRQIKDLINKMNPDKAGEMVSKAQEKAKQELQGFALDELEKELVGKTLRQDSNFKETYKILKLADSVNVNYADWIDNIWEKKKDDHGLNIMDATPQMTGLNVDTNTDDPGKGAKKHGFEYDKNDESEILLNRLRALYLQRALKGDSFTSLRTELKIRKLQNGLFKLGIFTEELDEKVQVEAGIIAVEKIRDQINEALVERASFYKLAGPAFDLVDKKLKGLLKSAERLKVPVSANDFNKLRDRANRKVFDLSKTELNLVRSLSDEDNTPSIKKREDRLIQLITRLREESRINDSSATA